MASLEEGISDIVNDRYPTNSFTFEINLIPDDDDDDSDDDTIPYGILTCLKNTAEEEIPVPKDWIRQHCDHWFILNNPKEMHPLLRQYGVNPWKHLVEVMFRTTADLPALPPKPTGPLERQVGCSSSVFTGVGSPISCLSRSTSSGTPVSPCVLSPSSENGKLKHELRAFIHRCLPKIHELQENPETKEEYESVWKSYQLANSLLHEL